MQNRVFKKHVKTVFLNLNVGLFNTRSLCNKTAGVFEFLSGSNINVCFLTETWLRKGDTSKIAEIKDLGFNIIHQSRAGRGGGVAIAFKKHLNYTRRSTKQNKSFELIECVMKSNSNELLRLCCVYRSCTATMSNISDFMKEFDEYLDSLTQLPGKLIIAGDFNIHVEDHDDPATKKFMHLLSNYGLTQHVLNSTHIGGGILDLVLTRNNVCDLLKIEDMKIVKTVTTSDHYFINFSIMFPHHKGNHKEIIMGRKLQDINIDDFKEDLLSSDLNNPDNYRDCNRAVELYNTELRRILDEHAPQTSFSINPDQSKWIDSKCQEAKRKRRKAERNHNRLQTSDSKSEYKKASKHAEAVINTTRQSYYENRLKSCEDNKKDTYKIVNQLMDRDISKDMKPNNKPAEVLCEEMKDFFKEKVETIYSEIDNDLLEDNLLESPHDHTFTGETWSKFHAINKQDLREILSGISKKECEEDPIPLKLLLQCFDEVESIILFIINDSLASGVFPSILKNAIVRPAIKDEKGDVNSYKNYRPISNLPFLSKLIEKTVQMQLTRHLKDHNLHAEHQSGYRTNHSCETATLTIYNDLLCISDIKSKVIVLLLDLSAAFDTVNHHLLMAKLKTQFGFTGSVLDWFESYLNNRSFTVTIDKSRSKRCFLRIGVPQGSILGPILFILYTKELNHIAERNGFSIHMYADDTQLYIEFNPLSQDFSTVEERIIKCFQDIKRWMSQMKLKLNQDKTEALVVQSKYNYSSYNIDSVQLGDDSIDPSPVVKSLGVLFDQFLTLEDQVNAIINCCNIHLRNLWVIGSKLSYELKRQLIHCLIFSKLDYCNGLLYGLPDFLIKKLQKVQNSCARFLFGRYVIKKWASIKPFLKKAHFLPIRERIDYKIALTAFKCLNNLAPDYLTKCIAMKSQPARVLRTDDDYFLLNVPSAPNYCRTERSFSQCGPFVWNRLPYDLRTETDIVTFKKKLKTYLFTEAFKSIQ